MLRRITGLFVLTTCMAIGCVVGQSENKYPDVLPLCVTEEDSAKFLTDRLDSIKPLRWDKALVLPLYKEVSVDGQKHEYAVWDPFVVKPSDDLERILSSRGQREKVGTSDRLGAWIYSRCCSVVIQDRMDDRRSKVDNS